MNIEAAKPIVDIQTEMFATDGFEPLKGCKILDKVLLKGTESRTSRDSNECSEDLHENNSK